MADPANVLAVDDIAIMTGYEVRPAVAAPEDIVALITRLDRLDDVVTDSEEDAATGPAEVVDLRESGRRRSGHQAGQPGRRQRRGAAGLRRPFLPGWADMRVRFRVDGVLHDATTVPKRMVAGVISRIKIMSDLDISERRLPQDGRVGLSIDGHHIDLRVVTLPSVHGESVVMRILDKDSVVMDLDQLGMGESERLRFEHAFNQAYGAVLTTGPTGSGKSTTLYAALLALNTRDENIITIEDPVEYQIEGITQVQVMTARRAHLRRRPALDGARRPRRHHGRRDPRPRDGRDRRRVRAHRAPGALDAAYQRRAHRHHPPDRDGHRAVSRRVGDRLRRRPAPGANAVRQLQAPHDHPGRGDG